MSESPDSGATPSEGPAPPEGPAPTPFDHPLFLPVLLAGLALWFGYDGFINTDPEMMEHRTFNQVGFGVLVVLWLRFGIRGLREWQEDRDQKTG